MTLEFTKYRSPRVEEALKVTDENIREIYEALKKKQGDTIYDVKLVESSGGTYIVWKNLNYQAHTISVGKYMSPKFVSINLDDNWEPLTKQETELPEEFAVTFKITEESTSHCTTRINQQEWRELHGQPFNLDAVKEDPSLLEAYITETDFERIEESIEERDLYGDTIAIE